MSKQLPIYDTSKQNIDDTSKAILKTNYIGHEYPNIFEAAFTPTSVVQTDNNFTLYTKDIGDISIESGKLVVTDPIVTLYSDPLSETFPTGKFPVQLSIAKMVNDERTAFCRIKFSDKSVKKWVVNGTDPRNKSKDNFDSCIGFGVDAGLGIIVDEKNRSAFMQVYDENTLKKGPGTWEYNMYEFAQDKTMAVFSTGYGDGHYCIYIGYDENDKMCRLLIDFNVVNW